MKNTFRFCSCSRGVQDKENLFCIKTFSNMFIALAIYNLVPPHILIAPGSLLSGALNNENIFHICRAFERFINCRLKCKCCAFAETTICCNDQLRISILNTREESISRETAEDNGVSSANASTRKHCNCGFRNHRHINCYAITSANSKFSKCVCCFLYIF